MDNPNFEAAVAESDKKEIHEIPLNAPILSTVVNVDADNQQQQTKVLMPQIEAPTDPPISAPKNEPISKLIDLIIRDPATYKLLTLIISVLAMYWVYPNVRRYFSEYLMINGLSFVYSIFAIFVTVIWKTQEKIGKNGILKKCFSGRNVYWHEFHSTMTLLLALANFSCIIFDANQSNLIFFFALSNFMAFGYEFFVTHKTSKLFVVEENVPKNSWKFTKFILGAFKNHPIKFNVLQWACCIAAFSFYLWQANEKRDYFVYCSLATILGSTLPLFFRLTKKCKCRCGNWFSSNPKIQTYLTIGILLHAFFAVFINYFDSQYYQCNYDFDNYNYSYGWNHCKYASLITITPISFAFSCIVLLLSVLDLHSQAIFHQSRSITESPQHPSIIKTEEKRPFRNLPTVLENPLGLEDYKKVYEY